MIARFLSRYHLSILLIEKEADIGMGATSANSAIVHAGYDPLPGSLKAKLNVQANGMWDTLAGELSFPFERRGDYVVAIGETELKHLDSLLVQGRKNGVPGMHMISGEEMHRREHNINPDVSGALWAPTGGICDPFGVVVAAAENAIQNGVTILVDTAFEDFLLNGKKIVGIKTTHGEFLSRWLINAAGIQSADVMHKAGIHPEFKITPRRGEYFVFDRAEITINNVLFPCPSEKGKGILVTTTLHGNTIVGPNAASQEETTDRPMTRAGMDEIWQGATKLVPSLQQRYIIAGFAGLRATGNAPCLTPGISYNGDFMIEIPTEVTGFVNLGGIESPGLTSAPGIAQMVVDLLRDSGEKLKQKKDWNPIRPPRPRFREMSMDEQVKLIKSDPSYARIICRCEMVTEGEILAELHAPLPARTYDAIKRRTWLGTGRCLGSFDMPRVVELIARDLGVSPLEVSKKGKGSEFLYRMTKDVEA
jgi:glycerol-3-phosphate dehydrogenase